MSKFILFVGLFAAQFASAESINCFGAGIGQFVQVLDVAGDSARIILSSPDFSNPANVNSIFDKTVKLEHGQWDLKSINIDPIPIVGGGVTIPLWPYYYATWPSVEGMARVEVVIAKEAGKIQFPGKFVYSEPGLVQPDLALTCSVY